jgi:hypothetical protein
VSQKWGTRAALLPEPETLYFVRFYYYSDFIDEPDGTQDAFGTELTFSYSSSLRKR